MPVASMIYGAALSAALQVASAALERGAAQREALRRAASAARGAAVPAAPAAPSHL